MVILANKFIVHEMYYRAFEGSQSPDWEPRKNELKIVLRKVEYKVITLSTIWA